MQDNRRHNALPNSFFREKAIFETILSRNVYKVVIILNKTVLAHAPSCGAHAHNKPRNLQTFAQNAWRSLNRIALRFVIQFQLRRKQELTKNKPIWSLTDKLAFTLFSHATRALIATWFNKKRFLEITGHAFN